MKLNNTFDVEENNDTVVLMPLKDLGELENDKLEGLYKTILRRFERKKVKRLVLDLRKADFFGSSALGFFVKLRQQVQAHGGEMALCNASDHAEKVFKAAHLDTLWPLCGTRAEALLIVAGERATQE